MVHNNLPCFHHVLTTYPAYNIHPKLVNQAMSTLNSNLKQSRLDFSVGKRTTSNNKNGKPSQTPPIPVEITKKKPSGKTEAVETDDYEDFILPSSDEEREYSEEPPSPETFKPTGKKDAPTPAGRATRASTKNNAKKTPKEKEEASDDLEKPRVSRTSKANIQPETIATKKGAAGAAPIAESKESLLELKIKDPKWTKHYAEVKKKMGLPPSKCITLYLTKSGRRSQMSICLSPR
jgi:DNA polymerase delta subunit 4